MASMKIRLAAIRAIEDERGRVTAENLLDVAQDVDHPLHDEFEWDNDKAGHQHRLHQARKLISSVRVIVVHETKRVSTVGYVHDPSIPPNEPGYISTTRLKTEFEAAQEAILVEITRVQAALERAREIASALDLISEFDDALRAMLELRSRIRKGPVQPEEQPPHYAS